MKIELKKDHIAVLREESGDVVGCFRSNKDAKQTIENAVCEHFSIVGCTLQEERDFIPPRNYWEKYLFHLHDDEEYVTLIMTYEYIY